MNIKSKLLIPRILFYWLTIGIYWIVGIIPYLITKGLGGLFLKILDKIDPDLSGITPKLTKNKIVRLYARKEGIRSVRIGGKRYTFKDEVDS